MTGPGEGARVEVRIASRFEEIDLVARLASAWLAHLRVNGGERDNLVLGLREALANAILHGNGSKPEKSVEVVFRRRDDLAVLRVTDEGEGFDPRKLPDPLAPENLLRPTGRGILLMKAYADEVEFDFARGTRVELRKVLPAPGASEEE